MPNIKNLDKAARRIKRAIIREERIIIYGDSDLDGVLAVIILCEAIKNLGGKFVEPYFPDRENEGYGINETALLKLKKFTPCLLISVDLGIGNWKEVEIGKKFGFEIIIIDHHEILEKLPKAKIVVNPKQKGDKYPFKQLASAGLVFKLSEVLFGKNMPDSLRRNFLELAAMATIADMMPKTDDNAEIIAQGLDYLRSTWRPGIQVLFEIEEFRELDLTQKIYKVNSLLNVRDVENNLPGSFRLLSSADKKEAEELAEKLRQKGIERKEKIQKIMDKIERKILNKHEPVIFEGSDKLDWNIAFLGIVASLAVQNFKKPVFLYAKGEKHSLGSVRSPQGFNVVEAMKGFSKNLISYGGHPQAAGFRIENDNLEKFKDHLINYFKKK